MTYGQAIPAAAKHLADYIKVKESGGDYNVVYGRHMDYFPAPITTMTIGALLDRQKGFGKKYGSSAIGAYQHIRLTLDAQAKRLGIPMTAAFSPGLQDDLAWDLMRQRGLDDFLAGKMALGAFGNALAREWASLPVLVTVTKDGKKHVRGRSWYDGDGLNAAGRSPESFEKALKEALRLHALAGKPFEGPVEPPAAERAPAPAPEAEKAAPAPERYGVPAVVGVGGGMALLNIDGPLFWVGLAMVLAAIGFVAFSLVRKGKGT